MSFEPTFSSAPDRRSTRLVDAESSIEDIGLRVIRPGRSEFGPTRGGEKGRGRVLPFWSSQEFSHENRTTQDQL